MASDSQTLLWGCKAANNSQESPGTHAPGGHSPAWDTFVLTGGTAHEGVSPGPSLTAGPSKPEGNWQGLGPAPGESDLEGPPVFWMSSALILRVLWPRSALRELPYTRSQSNICSD